MSLSVLLGGTRCVPRHVLPKARGPRLSCSLSSGNESQPQNPTTTCLAWEGQRTFWKAGNLKDLPGGYLQSYWGLSFLK